MTAPKIQTKSQYGSRFYVHPETDVSAPGVTSILNMLPKPFLKAWAAKVVAEAAVDQMPDVLSMVLRGGGRDAAVDHLKRSPERFTSGAATIGSDAHDLFERIAKGEDVKPAFLHPDMRAYADHFFAFCNEFQPEFVELEETVWSDTHGYAGSFDAIMRINGETVIADWKTTRSGVHEEVALQLAAYTNADYILSPDGSQRPIPKIEGAAVLHVRPEGWGLYPVRIDEDVFESFLRLIDVFKWERSIKRTVIGKPINSSAPKRAKGGK